MGSDLPFSRAKRSSTSTRKRIKPLFAEIAEIHNSTNLSFMMASGPYLAVHYEPIVGIFLLSN